MTYNYDKDLNKLVIFDLGKSAIDKTIIEEYYNKVRSIDLTRNKFSNFNCLTEFLDLREVIMDNNYLSDKTEFPTKRFLSVKLLSLNNNKFLDLEKLMKNLTWTFPNLRYLSLLGNPCCPFYTLRIHRFNEEENLNYRLFIITRLNKLVFLDSKKVEYKEVRSLANMNKFGKSSFEDRFKDEGSTTEANKNATMAFFKNLFKSKENNQNFNPLPPMDRQTEHIGFYGKLKHKYNGSNSEGNRFIVNKDL